MSGVAKAGTAFVLGGSTRSALGGQAWGLGGGEFVDIPWAITEFGTGLYVHSQTNTYVIDPAAGTHVETRPHGAHARARSSAVFDNALVVPLGAGEDTDVATVPRADDAETGWEIATGVRMSVARVGGSGRLFTSRLNLVFNVLAGQNPASLSNYLPTGGEVLTDETDPVRSLEEFARGLVAGTARTARTFDPEAGFISRAILPDNRLSISEHDGRGLLNTGEYLLYGSGRVIWMITPSGQKVRAGPETSDFNESPYLGGQPGVPDVAGDTIFWPFFFPDSGDSVVFSVRLREQGEPGIGPLVWSDLLWLENRECRVVRYWGGDSSTKPRLFFGAGTTSNKEQVGHVDLGRGGGPDIYDSDAVPARTGVLYMPHDDFGLPGVIQDVERVEVQSVENTTSTNYAVIEVSDDDSVTWKKLVLAQSGANQERIVGTGFQQVFADLTDLPSGTELTFRCTFTQAVGATAAIRLYHPVAYLSERSAMVEQVTTILLVRGVDGIDTAKDMTDRLEALAGAGKVKIQHLPGDITLYGKIHAVGTIEVEIETPSGAKERTVAVEVTWREVATG